MEWWRGYKALGRLTHFPSDQTSQNRWIDLLQIGQIIFLLCVKRMYPSQFVTSNRITLNTDESVPIDWQWPLSGVHSIKTVNSAQPGEGGGGGVAGPPPFTLSTITSKVVMYAPAEREETLLLFLLYPYMYSVLLNMSLLVRSIEKKDRESEQSLFRTSILLIRGAHFCTMSPSGRLKG
jgi:hypothetical protein